MKLEDVADIASISGAAVAVAVGVVAWKAWRTSERVRQDQAEAEALRRWRELRPDLNVTASRPWGNSDVLLTVTLVGPRDVERYDWIRVTVRDDKERPWPGPQCEYTEDELRRQVWQGPGVVSYCPLLSGIA